MQKTDFRFEVLINDDASTDNTAAIIKEYEEKYPEIIKPIYQTENQYSKGVKIVKTHLLPRAKGKYIARCEGDDFWTDPLKLQKQYDAMEANPDCHFCTHTVQVIFEDGSIKNETIPKLPPDTQILSTKSVLEAMAKDYSFQTGSFFVRTEDHKRYWQEDLLFREKADVGDGPMILYFANLGNTYFFNETMSNYRVGSIGSWGSRTTGEKRKQHHLHMIEAIKEYDKYTDFQYTEACQDYIFRHAFPVFQYDCEYANILRPEYARYYKKLPLKYKLCARADSLFPHLFRSVLKMHRKGQG